MFFKGSRYTNVKQYQIVDSQGRVIPYKRVRFIPETEPQELGLQQTHLLSQGERLDHIAYHFYRDAERFWRICDANHAMWPDDLVAGVGRRILIPSSED